MNESRKKVAVIGQGNVGSQMARIFETDPVSSRSLHGLASDADLYVIAVSDNAVADVASRLPVSKGIVVHTTGSVAMRVLENVECGGYGVLYPFQTISKARPLSPDKIPLMIEGSDDKTAEIIQKVAESYGFTHTMIADSDIRRRTHLAGTFVCNFTNALIGIGQKIFRECGIDPKIANPLVEETVEKLQHLPAAEAQTGPAIRGDETTLNKHRELLGDLGMDSEKKIYDLLSSYIMSQKK